MERFYTARDPLSVSDLRAKAPSIFTKEPHGTVSERYGFIPTTRVASEIIGLGWAPVAAQESKTRDEAKQGYTKHLIRFRAPETLQRELTVGEDVVELVLVNSHDRSTAFKLYAGLFRLVCANGLIIGDAFDGEAIRHIGYTDTKVIDAVFRVVEDLPAKVEKISNMKNTNLSGEEQLYFAEAAALTKFTPEQMDELADHNIPGQLLRAHRSADHKDDLWTVFNRTQENIIGGGISYTIKDKNGRTRNSTTRRVKAVAESIRLNTALWTLADKMLELKARV
jgi:hypothetical protein